MSSRGARWGMGPSACTRVAEIMSGRAISQQGLAATCKDLANKAQAEARGGFWSGAWARMSCEGGATPSEEAREASPTAGNTRGGQRSPGYSAVAVRRRRGDMAVGSSWPNSSPVWTMSRPGPADACWDEETGKPPAQGVHASQRLSLGVRGQARTLINACRAETRTGLGKSDRPGSQRGFGKRGQSEVAPCGARVRFLSRQPHAPAPVGFGFGDREIDQFAGCFFGREVPSCLDDLAGLGKRRDKPAWSRRRECSTSKVRFDARTQGRSPVR